MDLKDLTPGEVEKNKKEVLVEQGEDCIPYLRLNGLSLAFFYRTYSDKFYDVTEFGMKGCLTMSSLGWKPNMSLGQDKSIYTNTDQNTRHFIREACYGGGVEVNIQEFN